MCRLLFKLCKNENNSDISLYLIYFPKLHENISKYYRLNSFKKIAIGFNHDLRTTWKSLASLSNSLLV